MTRLWKRAVAKAGLPDSTIPYALRHSSIVRGLRFGLPIRLVAALHDTSVAMIERHYSRWITEGLDELAARAVVPIVSIAA
jgi:site-specific recombinase XerD